MSTFSTDTRVLVCANCGAPLPSVGPEGGQVQCSYCNTATWVGQRDDSSIGTGAPVDESQRIAMLWQQLDRGFEIHQEVMALMEQSLLPERNVPEAQQRWEQARVAAANPAIAASVGDDLLWLTTALTGYWSPLGDRNRVRALWESALEASHGARQRQFVRGSLCRLAINDGDTAAATQWLRPCDPQPTDLCMDSTYRLSYACLATANGDFDNALQALGPDANALPWFFTMRVLSAVVRANAVEKRGDVGGAVNLLRALVGGVPDAAVALPGIRRANVGLDLCPQSIPAVAG